MASESHDVLSTAASEGGLYDNPTGVSMAGRCGHVWVVCLDLCMSCPGVISFNDDELEFDSHFLTDSKSKM